MRNRLKLLAVFLFVAILTASPQARAERFVAPTLPNILKTLLRFGVLDIKYDDVVDLYGSVMVCDLFKEYSENDFKWQEIRGELRKNVVKEGALFPTAYRYDTPLQLGKYDFRTKMYRLTVGTTHFNANVFRLVTTPEEHCEKNRGLVLPNDFMLVLEEPVQIIGLPMTPEDGKKLYERMVKNGNEDLIIYARFNLQVVYVEPFLRKTVKTAQEEQDDFLSGKGVEELSVKGEIRFDARLDSIEYYEDKERTKMIYKYQK